MLAHFFQPVQIDLQTVIFGSIGAAVLTAALNYRATYHATSKANAKSEGRIETTLSEGFKRIDAAIVQERADRVAADDQLRQTDRDQWKRISEVEGDVRDVSVKVARIEGRFNGKAHGASAGG